MHHGLPLPSTPAADRARTGTWVYWSGALFCLLADVEIRALTHNRRSLGDGLRAIVAAGGNVSKRWPLRRVLGTIDAATGRSVLAKLYARAKREPTPVDLDALWRRLGIRLEGERLHYDAAPLAHVRQALVLGRQPRAAMSHAPWNASRPHAPVARNTKQVAATRADRSER